MLGLKSKVIIIALLTTACKNPTGNMTRAVSTPAEFENFHLFESYEDFPNPERGFYKTYNLLGSNPLAAAQNIRATGYSIAWAKIDLAPYINSSIPDGFWTPLDRGFDAARTAGIKLIIRPVYNDNSGGADASLPRMLEHIAWLSPLLFENADVVVGWQAGFIGAWGEWHSSASGHEAYARSQVLKAMLKALPGRNVDVRTPMFKQEIFQSGPLDENNTFFGLKARTGHYNDCFLASPSDYGTYGSPISFWMDWLAQDSRYTSMGGETCVYYAPRAHCDNALPEMARNHWTYINSEYNQVVYNNWKDQGCYEQIKNRLGYRFVAKNVSFAPVVKRGDLLKVQFDVENVGFAAPINKRSVYIILHKGNARRVFLVLTDIRTWYAGQTKVITEFLTIPEDIQPGIWSFSLWMPDRDPRIRKDTRFSIRMANHEAWDPVKGWNLLANNLIVE